MNLYFWAFWLYALMITPVSVGISMRAGKEFRWRMRVSLAGLPVFRQTEEDELSDARKVDSHKAMKSLLALDGPSVVRLVRSGILRRSIETMRLESVWIRARISFADAAWTAMTFAAVRTVMQTLYAAHGPPLPLRGRVEADFQGKGTEVFCRCIFTARLGRLALTMIRLLAAMISIRAQLTLAEEGTYAASH